MATVWLCASPAEAGIDGSEHDFAGKAFAARGACSACHRPHRSEAALKSIWPRSLSAETAYFEQTSEPDYVKGLMILCYDCHIDATDASPTPDNDPSGWTLGADPQNIAFTDARSDNKLATSQVGYYELVQGTIPTTGNDAPDPPGSPPVTTSTGGHFFKGKLGDTPNSPYGLGDKLECWICHDAHHTALVGTNQVMMRTTITAGGASITIGDGLLSSSRSRNHTSGTGREMCAGCHNYYADGQGSYSGNTLYGVRIMRPTQMAFSGHESGDPEECTTCHPHNAPDCGACHGRPPAPAEPGYSALDETKTPHAYHAGATGAYGFACSQCHRNFNTTHMNATYSDVVFDTTKNPSGSWNSGGRTCTNLYCHSRGTSISDTTSNLVVNGGTLAWTAANWNNPGTDLGCEACHGTSPARSPGNLEYGAPGYPNGTPKANSHPQHLYDCAVCHYNVVRDTDPAGGWTLYDLALHANNTTSGFTYNVNPDTTRGYAFTYAWAATAGSCSDISCHGGAGTSATWGDTNLSCLGCHGTTGADVNNFVGNDNTASRVNTNEYNGSGHGDSTISLTCESCHDKAVPHDQSAGLTGPNPFRLAGPAGYTDPNTFCSDTDNCHTGGNSSVVLNHTKENMSSTQRTWPSWRPKCVDCHDPHGDRAAGAAGDNVAMVQADLFDAGSSSHGVPTTPKTADVVDFTFRGGIAPGSYADEDAGGADSICQECHTAIGPNPQESFLDDDSAHPVHGSHPTTGLSPCISCHTHRAAFEPAGCESCHDSTPAVRGSATAPNVMGDGTSSSGTGLSHPKPYDDGNYGFNVNGHGRDSDTSLVSHGNPIDVGCVDDPATSSVIEGCHDVSQPPNTHPDGVLNGRLSPDTRNANSFHLISGFINASPGNDWSVQMTFDGYCWTACHSASTTDMRHSKDSVPAANAMQMGTHYTYTEPHDNPPPWMFYDRNLTTLLGAWDGGTNFATCASCHNPHGTNIVSPRADENNKMIIHRWADPSILCAKCHN